jgi:hypothetical protein
VRNRLCLGLCALGVLLAGCGSTTPSDNTVAGIRAAAQDIVANLEAGRYKRACEDLTVRARSDFSLGRGGCVGALAFARGLLAIEGYPRLGQIVEDQVNSIVRHVDVEGIRGIVSGHIEVLYEDGRWRFEARRAAALAGRPHFRATLARTLRLLGATGIDALVEAARAGA